MFGFLADIKDLGAAGSRLLRLRGHFLDEHDRQWLLALFPWQRSNADLDVAGLIAPFEPDAGVLEFLAGLEHLLQAGGQRDGQILHRDLGDVVHQPAGRQPEIALRLAQDMQHFHLLVHHHRQRDVIPGE